MRLGLARGRQAGRVWLQSRQWREQRMRLGRGLGKAGQGVCVSPGQAVQTPDPLLLFPTPNPRPVPF